MSARLTSRRGGRAYNPAMFRQAALVFIVGLSACAANSDGRWRDRPLDADGPLNKLRAALAEDPDADVSALEPDALAQLEDLVEAAATQAAGVPIDAPTPTINEFRFIAELRLRDAPDEDVEEYFVEATYPDDTGFGPKYLFDHLGEAAETAIDLPEAADLCSAIDSFVLGETSYEEALPRVRELEAKIYAASGVTLEQAIANEKRYDAAVDELGAYSDPPSRWPFSCCHIDLPRTLLEDSLEEIVMTYGHELMHCVFGEWETDSEEVRTIEETSCEVFGDRVVEAFEARGGFANEDEDDEGEDDPELGAMLDSWYDELALLYHDDWTRFGAYRTTLERYGYTSKSIEGPNVAEELRLLQQKLPLAQFVAVAKDLQSLEELGVAWEVAHDAGPGDVLDADSILQRLETWRKERERQP